MSQQGTPKRISLCMIVKDEEEFLAGCLTSVQGLVDEIVLVDTGSTDRTVEIAKEFGARVYGFTWIDDFSAARNDSLEYATGDWVLVLDADEVLDAASHAEVRRLVESEPPALYTVRRLEYRERAGGRPEEQSWELIRLFPNHLGLQFEGCVHESIRQEANSPPVIDSNVIVHHYGYQPQVRFTRRKDERYLLPLEQRVCENPDSAWWVWMLGRTYYHIGRFGEAEQTLQRAAALMTPADDNADPLIGCIYVDLAHALIGQRRDAEAAEICRKALRLMPRSPGAHYVHAKLLVLGGALEAALESYARALEYEPDEEFPDMDRWTILHGIGEAHTLLGRWEEARAALEEARALSPTEPAVLAGLARVYAQLGHTGDAERFARQAIAEPDAPVTAWWALADLLVARGADEEAEGTLRAGLARHGEDAGLYRRLATLLARTRRWQESAAHWTRYLAQCPDDPAGHLGFAAAAAKLGDDDAAQRHLRLALAGSPAA